MLTDDELVSGFEAGTLPAFRHADHVRLTIVYLTRFGLDETLRKMYDGLLRFASSKGHPEKFHVTMTRAWVELIEAARQEHPDADAHTLIARCPRLLNQDALLDLYTPERLHSAAAREQWLPPDRGH